MKTVLITLYDRKRQLVEFFVRVRVSVQIMDQPIKIVDLSMRSKNDSLRGASKRRSPLIRVRVGINIEG